MSKQRKPNHGKKWMPAMYVAYYGILKVLAKKHGYALCVHGSIVRDFDLIAVPFDQKVSTHKDFLDSIRSVVGSIDNHNTVFDIVGIEPHGRTCYTIECGAGGYFDISFTPSIQEAVKKVKEEKFRDKEIKKLIRTTRHIQCPENRKLST